jgi:hypothetical protein
MINLASRLGVAPAQGHTGFDRVVMGDEKSMDPSYSPTTCTTSTSR